MTTEEWVAAALATAPPLTPAQLAILRPVCQRMAAHINAAPARQREPHTETAPATPERNAS